MEKQKLNGSLHYDSGSESVSVMNSDEYKSVVHYDKAGVFVRFEYASEEFPEDDAYVRGAVTLTEQYIKSTKGSRKSRWLMTWSPRQEEEDWFMIQSMIGGNNGINASSPPNSAHFNKREADQSASADKDSKQSKSSKVSFSLDVEKVTEIRKVNPGLGYPVLAVFTHDLAQPACPFLEFHDRGVKELFSVLKKFMSIKQSKTDPNLWYLTPRGHDWSQSLSALNMGFADPTYIAGVHSGGAYDMTVDGLSRVKNYVFDNFLHQKKLKKTRPKEECVDDEELGLGGAASVASERFGINNRLEPGYDMITCVTVNNRPAVKWEREKPIDEEEYARMIDVHGRILDPDMFTQRVFKGGIVVALKPTLWKYLLGYYACESTLAQNVQMRKQKEDEYFRMKLQWKTFSQDQIRNFSAFREKAALIEKDVIRTDRTDDFFKGSLDSNVNLCKLYDILMTYCMFNFDLGYLQGMSDLLAPLLMVLQDEVDTFWCFVGLMKLTGVNFDMDDEKGMKLQLSQLKYLLNLLDPSFYAFLESKESGNLFFCFRWLLIWFKREFNFKDICTLWEVLWTKQPCANFHLFICLSILDLEKNQIMAKDLDFTEILKHINEVQLRMNVTKVLKNAEAIFLQVKQIESKLPDKIRVLLSAEGDNSCRRKQHDEADEEFGDMIGSVGPVTSLNGCANFSEMYKSVVSLSPSLVVPPLSDSEEATDDLLTL